MAKWTKEEDEALKTALANGEMPSNIHVGDHTLRSIFSRMSRLGLHSVRFKSKTESGYALRKCLPCGKTFGSDHIGNRICPVCHDAMKRQAA